MHERVLKRSGVGLGVLVGLAGIVTGCSSSASQEQTSSTSANDEFGEWVASQAGDTYNSPAPCDPSLFPTGICSVGNPGVGIEYCIDGKETTVLCGTGMVCNNYADASGQVWPTCEWPCEVDTCGGPDDSGNYWRCTAGAWESPHWAIDNTCAAQAGPCSDPGTYCYDAGVLCVDGAVSYDWDSCPQY